MLNFFSSVSHNHPTNFSNASLWLLLSWTFFTFLSIYSYLHINAKCGVSLHFNWFRLYECLCECACLRLCVCASVRVCQSQKKNKNQKRKLFFRFRHSSVPFVTFMLFRHHHKNTHKDTMRWWAPSTAPPAHNWTYWTKQTKIYVFYYYHVSHSIQTWRNLKQQKHFRTE